LSVWGGESIHDAILSTLTSPPTGRKVNKLAFSYNGDGSIKAIQFFDADNNLLFTLTFSYSAGSVVSITRS
jgi:hypothetical protein